MRSGADADATLRLAPPPPPRRPVLGWRLAAGVVVAGLALGVVAWLIWPHSPGVPKQPAPPPPVVASVRPPPVQPVPAPPAQALSAPPVQPVPASPVQPLPAPPGQPFAAPPAQPPPFPPAQALSAPPMQPVPVSPGQPVPVPPAPGQAAQPAAAPASAGPRTGTPPAVAASAAQSERPAAVAPPAVRPAPPAAKPAAPPPIPIQTADEAQILADMPRTVTVFRFAPDPSIVVLDFASLREQGLMLNRVAALVEKAAAPRDRVLNDAQLGALIRASGDTVETYYYGHDYSAAELARFFRLAEAQHVQLYPEEVALHKLLVELGWLQPGVNAALITVPKQGANPEVTAAARATILRHELSHGEYFSNPAYQAYVHRFWEYSLTDTERHAVRDYLTSEEYDAKIESLLESEMQAYLMFTPDPAFFAPSKIGMTPEHLRQLQRQFYFGMPNGWLRNVLGETLAKANAAAR